MMVCRRMRRKTVRFLPIFFSIALLTILTACQTPGSLGGFGGTGDTAASADQAPADGRVSKSYNLFSDQGDHLADLVKAGNFEDAAKLFGEQSDYFTKNRAKQRPLLSQVADTIKAQHNPALETATSKLKAISWPSPQSGWANVKQALIEARKTLSDYPDLAILKDPEFRTEAPATLDQAIRNLSKKIQQSAPQEFANFDHFETGNFFDAYAADLDAENFIDEHFATFEGKLTGATTARIRAFAGNYPKDMLGDARWGKLGDSYVAASLKESGGNTGLESILRAINGAATAGFKAKSVPGVNIGFVEVTSLTLLKNKQIEFSATIDVDLPVKFSKADLDEALTNPAAQEADYLVVFDVALAKASRRITKTQKMPARVLAEIKVVNNPEYRIAEAELRQAQLELQNASMDSAMASNRYCYGLECLGNMIATASANSKKQQARTQVDMAMQVLKATPQTIEEPVYARYAFDKATVKGTKSMTVNYYVIDRKKNKIFKSSFDISERQTFEVGYNIQSQDPDKDSHYEKVDKESDVSEWEDDHVPIKLSQLVTHYLRNKGAAKRIPSLMALRKEMLKDKNAILAKAKKEDYGYAKHSDPRMDSVVAIYVSAKRSMGTGFYIMPDIILTNWHVVEENKFVEMKKFNKLETFGKVLAKDIRLDLALVKVQDRGKPVRFYSDTTIDLGATVEVLGHPNRLEFSVTRGVVSTVRKMPNINLSSKLGSGDKVLYIQTDAPVNGGNSGGPLFLKNKVIGVNTWGYKKMISEGLNFAVHYSEVMKFLKEYLPEYQAYAASQRRVQ